ncbi:MAG: hypothetical protein M3P84_04235 [Chloroflexota bacterium]|nr:hypothetical protein [Chloroflexota bacterium]
MRGCLVTIVFLLGIAVAASWFVLPPLVGTLAQGALVAAGFEADSSTVTVSADPPPRLLTLKADSVRIQATNLTYRGLQATSADITLNDVGFAERSFRTIAGTLRGVRYQPQDGPELSAPLVRLSGRVDRIRATLTLPAIDAEALAIAAVEGGIGITPRSVLLTAPDHIQIDVGGLAVAARLAVREDGTLNLVAPTGSPIGSIALVVPGPDAPFRIESFDVVDGGLVIVATFLTDLN